MKLIQLIPTKLLKKIVKWSFCEGYEEVKRRIEIKLKPNYVYIQPDKFESYHKKYPKLSKQDKEKLISKMKKIMKKTKLKPPVSPPKKLSKKQLQDLIKTAIKDFPKKLK